MDHLKPEPSLEDNPFELSESDEDEEESKNDSNTVKSEDLSQEEPKPTDSIPSSPLDDILLPTANQAIKAEPKEEKSDSENKDGKKKDGKSKKELEEEDREKMQ